VEAELTESKAGTLYVVSTPIGNMGDFSFRAVETLRSVSAVLAEDTRHTRHLLDRYEIETPLVAYHEHNEAKTTPRLVERLLGGESLALVSDAGTPLLSDPGGRLVRAAIDAGVRVSPVPGASALLAALVASGLDTERFTFFGFLARKGPERRAAIDELVVLRHAAVLYEAPARVGATLNELAEAGSSTPSDDADEAPPAIDAVYPWVAGFATAMELFPALMQTDAPALIEPLALLYRQADIFCLPSVQEGFGIVFLEAMACGLPVVATFAAAIPEVVPDRRAGLLVPPGDLAALAHALIELLARPSQRASYGAFGHDYVERFDWDRVAQIFLEQVAPFVVPGTRVDTSQG